MLTSAATILALILVTWALSVAFRDASIVDPVWPLGFVAIAWTLRATVDSDSPTAWLLVAMVSVWGLRLSGYLAWRKHGAPEDYRYQAMRRRWGSRFWIISLATVFGLQGVLMWVVSLPLQLGLARPASSIGALAIIGALVWTIGFGFESIGDVQLARFKADPANAGRVMDRGLWRYTRHPNYFGDACAWWGIALVAASTVVGSIGFVGSLVMTVLLLRISGVALLERSLQKRKAGWAEYASRTSAFVPRPPRRPPDAM